MPRSKPASAKPSVSQLRDELRARLRSRQKPDGYPLYAADPYGFVPDILDERPWSIQRRIMEAVRDHPYVAVPSCFGSGKDWIAARIGFSSR